jgi:predicted acylesterase/phospholipase RssA
LDADILPEIPSEKDFPALDIVPDGKCRALALRGGGTKGAYEIGALKVMIEEIGQRETAYDVIEGVSAGGINAAILATFKVGDDKRAVEYMYNMWSKFPATALWRNWPYLGPVEAFFHSSILDAQDFVDKVDTVFQNRTF